MIKYCPNCGKKIIHDIRYCNGCGIDLKQFNVKNSVEKNENDSKSYNEKLLAQGYKKCPKCGHKLNKNIETCPFCEAIENPRKNKIKRRNGIQYIINQINNEKTENNDESEICQECGAKINPKMNYCQNCGVNHPPHILSKINQEKKKKDETSKNTPTKSRIYENTSNKTITYENTNKLKKCPKCGRNTNAYLAYCEHCMSEQSNYFLTNDPSIKRRNEAFKQRKIRKNDKKVVKTKSTKKSNVPVKAIFIMSVAVIIWMFLSPPIALALLVIFSLCIFSNKFSSRKNS